MVVGRRQGTVSVDGYVDILMNQEVVARPRADELEIVDEVIRDPDYPYTSRFLGHAGRFVLVTGNLSDPENPLRLVMELEYGLIAVEGDVKQVVEDAGEVHQLAGAAVGAIDKHLEINLDLLAHREGDGSRGRG